MKSKCLVFIAFTVLAAFNCAAQERLIGEIISTRQDRLYVGLGDMVLTNIGTNDGVLKGDILTVFSWGDPQMNTEVAKCAVVTTRESTSLCEPFKMKVEIGRRDHVTTNKATLDDKNLYLPIVGLMTRLVELYPPHGDISVYVHQFYDEKNNTTAFSEKFRGAVLDLLSQKKRIKLVGDDTGRSLALYPHEYSEIVAVTKNYMTRDRIDLMVVGSYKTLGDKTELSIYAIDKNWGDRKIILSIDTKGYGEQLTRVMVPYVPIERKENIAFKLFYKPQRYVLQKDERRDIIAYEAGGNPFAEYNFGRIDFNILSPVDVRVNVDGEMIKFDGRNEHHISLPRGSHKISTSFKRGYFHNESLMFTSTNEVKKEFALVIDHPGDVDIDILMNPLYGKESTDLKVYRKTEKERRILRSVQKTESEKGIETFKD